MLFSRPFAVQLRQYWQDAQRSKEEPLFVREGKTYMETHPTRGRAKSILRILAAVGLFLLSTTLMLA